MTDLLSKIRKASNVIESDTISKSIFYNERDEITTDIPMLNLAFSGSLYGGYRSGITTIAGPSKHFKTLFGLMCAKAYMQKYEDGVVLFYDSEFGTPESYFVNLGIDTDRVLHVPITSLEALKHDMVKRLDSLNRGDHVFIFIDSLGNAASLKEIEDAEDGKSVADMTRAKSIKSLFRIIAPSIVKLNIPVVVVNHTYQSIGFISKTVVSGGCVVPETRVRMGDNTIKPISEIVVDESVQTLGGSIKVSHVWDHSTLDAGEPECYEIVLEDDTVLVCSYQHKLMDSDGNWLLVNELAATDYSKVKLLVVDRLSKKNWALSQPKYGNQFIKNITSVGKMKVCDLTVPGLNHYITENGLVNHNTGAYYNSDTIWIVGRRQEKEGKELVGYDFTINVEKSRFVREKSKFPITVRLDTGIDRYTGLLELGVELGFVEKIKRSFQVVGDDKLYTKKTINEEFWNKLLTDEFNRVLMDKFAYSQLTT